MPYPMVIAEGGVRPAGKLCAAPIVNQSDVAIHVSRPINGYVLVRGVRTNEALLSTLFTKSLPPSNPAAGGRVCDHGGVCRRLRSTEVLLTSNVALTSGHSIGADVSLIVDRGLPVNG